MSLGRPSSYSDETAATICEGLLNGESLRSICLSDEMPNRSTISRWLDENKAFATKYAHAREMQADHMDDLILDTADKCTPETAAADRVKIAAYQWRAAKLKPKVYGDKLDVTSGGEKIGAEILATRRARAEAANA